MWLTSIAWYNIHQWDLDPLVLSTRGLQFVNTANSKQNRINPTSRVPIWQDKERSKVYFDGKGNNQASFQFCVHNKI